MLICGIPISFAALPFMGGLLLIFNSLGGLRLAALSTAAIANHRERGTFELLATLPEGIRSSMWLLALGAVQQSQVYRELASWRKWIPRYVIGLPTGLTLIFLGISLPAAFGDTILRITLIVPIVALYSSAAALILYSDNIQSITIAVITALITASRVQTVALAQVSATLLFIILQGAGYLAAAVLFLFITSSFVTLAVLIDLYAWAPDWFQFHAAIGIVLVFGFLSLVVSRELLTRFMLWGYQSLDPLP